MVPRGIDGRLVGLFQKGVLVIYEDALEVLKKEEKVLDRLLELNDLPEELTKTFLDRLLEKEQSSPHLGKKLNWSQYFLPKFPEKVDILSFLQLFLSRYSKISNILKKRPTLRSAISIERLKKLRGREEVAIIAMVREVRRISKDKKIVVVEDPTGSITVIFTKDAAKAPEVDEIIEDEVIGVTGSAGRGVLFADKVFFPEIPQVPWPKGLEGKGLFLSDVHMGSKKFNENSWDGFLEYIDQNPPNFIIIAGDLVDGTGIYQGQDEELEIEDITEQYSELARRLKELPKDIPLFLAPGNHDASAEGEPQPPVPKDLAEDLYRLKNVVMLPNPAGLLIEGKLKVLLYHGTSLDGVIDSIESIRKEGYLKPTIATKILLRKRHLSPIFGRNRIYPTLEDYLVIEDVPNVLHTGHVHTADFSIYRGVRLISSGTFQDRTAFQEKLGHHPTTGKFVELDLSTGKARIVDFGA